LFVDGDSSPNFPFLNSLVSIGAVFRNL
jgi:hypothetical protein